LHKIIFSIYHAESNIRAYTLNQQETHLNAYFDELSKINAKVDSLYELADNDPFILQTIDSINVQLLNKTRLLDQFIQLKSQDQNSIFYERALDEIMQVTEEEPLLREVTHHTIVPEAPADTIEHTPEEIQQEKENFFSRLRNFFAGRRDEPTPEPEETTAEEIHARDEIMEIQTDSIIKIYRDTARPEGRH
jgi:hypothetical protein